MQSSVFGIPDSHWVCGIHTCGCIYQWLVLFHCWVVLHPMPRLYHLLFIHFPVDRHLDSELTYSTNLTDFYFYDFDERSGFYQGIMQRCLAL